MTSQRVRVALAVLPWTAALLGAVVVVGCSKSGPAKYRLSGKVTYGGKPITYGDIRFEPKEGMNNAETIGFARIHDGKYETEVVGGPHWFYVRDLTGDVDMGDPASAGGRAQFLTQYRAEVALPALVEVKGAGTTEKDIDIPTTHK
jgi:hypothetical protein